MNEIKNRSASRITFSVLWVGSCLFGGFAIGSKVHTPWKTATISFQSVSWLAQAKETQLARASTEQLQSERIQLELDFAPFEPLKPTRFASRSFQRSPQNWKRLSQALLAMKRAQVIQDPSLNLESLQLDYRLAAFELKQDFSLALVPRIHSAPTVVLASRASVESRESVEMKQSSAQSHSLARIENKIRRPRLEPKAVRKLVQKVTARAPLRLEQRPMQHSVQQPPVQQPPPPQPVQKRPTPLAGSQKNLPHSQTPDEVVVPSGLSLAEAKELQSALQSEQIKSWNERIDPTVNSTVNSTANLTVQAKGAPRPELNLPLVPLLIPNSKRTQAPLVLAPQSNPTQVAQHPVKTGPANGSSGHSSKQDSQPEPLPESQGEQTSASWAPEGSDESNSSGRSCEQLHQTRFMNPMGIQVCPSRHEWITTSGWVKTHFEDALPTLSLYPAPHSGSTLLLDTNSIALLGVKNGTSFIRGMGIVVGTVPEGYEVSYSGRSEEAEYFEVLNRRYFAILNAEPGAGVITLTHSQEQSKSTTVFSPVLEDTITYLDLVEPQPSQFVVKVQKKDTSSEVDRLKVGISTRGEMDAITQTDGRALFRNVYLMPGYPVYLDVSSKYRTQAGPNYRYLLRARDQKGQYILKQFPEEQLYRWIEQLGQVGPQEAILIGELDRKKLGGFKHHHQAKIKMLSPQGGIAPITHSVLWNQQLSLDEPLEGDQPRFLGSRLQEGLALIEIRDENQKVKYQDWFPVSPRVIHVISP